MDLLCTENIMKDNESEIIYAQQPQQQQQQPQQQQKEHLNEQFSNRNNYYTVIYSSDSCSSTSSSSTLSSTSSSGSTSSGYNSSNSYASFKATNTTNKNTTKTTDLNAESSNNINNEPTTSLLAAVGLAGQSYNAEPHTKIPYYNQFHQQQQQQLQNIARQQQQQQQQQQYYNNKNKEFNNHIINRSLDYVNTATEDPTFLSDRCLENALKTEEKRPQTICTYFKTVQKDITPPMRKIVAEWMMEVCAEEKCQDEVVLLALNYMDRFLSTKSVRKTHLQILAAACLLLASKLREPSCRALSADLLVFYTDNSIYKSDLIKWELYVLSRLGWDLSSVTPLDFLELLLIRLPIRNSKCPDLNIDKVRQHAQAFISLAAKEHYFSIYSASTIAASSIAAALNGLNWHLRTGQNMRNLLNLLTDLTSVEQDYLHDCMMKMEAIFEEHSRKLQPYMITVEHQAAQQQQQQHVHQQHLSQNVQTTHQQHQQQHQQRLHSSPLYATSAAVLPDLTQTCKMQANAQKDVQDIKF